MTNTEPFRDLAIDLDLDLTYLKKVAKELKRA